MLYSVNLSDEVRLWWDERNEMRSGYKYKVTVNGKNCVMTERNYYNFKNLQAGKQYKFLLEVVDLNKNSIGKAEEFVTTTLPHKECIDVTKPPYNAIGDGKTDCTANIQKAFSDCTADKYIYFPFGIYVCEGVKFSGDTRVLFDAGAIMCSKAEVKKL